MNPTIPNIQQIISMGINPATGLPYKIGTMACQIKDDIRKQMRVLDEQCAVNRYKWKNLPKGNGLDGQLLERILYYKGQGAFFYMKELDTYFFLPYALSGTIDVYGRFQGITPVQFAGGSVSSKDGKVKAWINGLVRKPVYEIGENEYSVEENCVLLTDYSKQLAELVIPRQILQEPLLDIMAESVPLARTSLVANSGVKGVRVSDQDQSASVNEASNSVLRSALNGTPWVPIVGSIEFQELTNGNALKSEEYLSYMQALDNYRLSLYGIKNGGVFQKKAHMLEDEQDMNNSRCEFAYEDGFAIRQRFCEIVNKVFGLNISVEKAEMLDDEKKRIEDNGPSEEVTEVEEESNEEEGEQ